VIESDFVGWLTMAMSAPSPIDELKTLSQYRGVEEVEDQAVAALSISINRHLHESDQGFALLFMMSAVVYLDLKRASALVAPLSEALSEALRADQLPPLEQVFARSVFRALHEGQSFEPELLFEEHQLFAEQHARLLQGGHHEALSSLCAGMLDSYAGSRPAHLSAGTLQVSVDELMDEPSLTLNEEAPTNILSEEPLHEQSFASHEALTQLTPAEGLERTESRAPSASPQLRLNVPLDSLEEQLEPEPRPSSPFIERLQMNTAELDFLKKESLALEALRLAEEAQAHALAAQREAQRTHQEASEARLRAEARAQAEQAERAEQAKRERAEQTQRAQAAQYQAAQPSPYIGQGAQVPQAQAFQLPQAQPLQAPQAQPFQAPQAQPFQAPQAQPFSGQSSSPYHAAQAPEPSPFGNHGFNAAPRHIIGGLSAELPAMLMRQFRPAPPALLKLMAIQALAAIFTLIFAFQIGTHYFWIGALLLISSLLTYQGKRFAWQLSVLCCVLHGLYMIMRLSSPDFPIYLKSPALYLIALGMMGLGAALLREPIRVHFKSTKRF